MQFDQPGCFGFAASFNVRSKVCQGCDFKADCEVSAKRNLEEVAKSLNVDAVTQLMQQQPAVKKPKAAETPKSVSPMREKILANMSAHVARAAGMILDTGLNHRLSLIKGINSMQGRKPSSVAILFDLLLAGPVTRTTYSEALQQQLGYTQATASSQASIGIAAVTGIGIAKDAGDGSIVIRGYK